VAAAAAAVVDGARDWLTYLRMSPTGEVQVLPMSDRMVPSFADRMRVICRRKSARRPTENAGAGRRCRCRRRRTRREKREVAQSSSRLARSSHGAWVYLRPDLDAMGPVLVCWAQSSVGVRGVCLLTVAIGNATRGLSANLIKSGELIGHAQQAHRRKISLAARSPPNHRLLTSFGEAEHAFSPSATEILARRQWMLP
jgi:hypothetical protein